MDKASKEPEPTKASSAGEPAAVTCIQTGRLVLRAPTAADARDLARLAGQREIADTTISIPHPYSEAQALAWVHAHAGTSGNNARAFVLHLKASDTVIGAVGLRDIDAEHDQAEMSFWVGVAHWGQGYATEAGRALVDFGFQHLNLNRIYAHHMVRNPASGRVLERLGMHREGLLRQRVRKWGVFEDVVIWAILKSERAGHPA